MASRHSTDEIRVRVTNKPDRRFLGMYYVDPITGKQVTRSTRTTSRRDAEREAAKWENDLRNGRYKPLGRISWGEFRQRYEDEVLPSLAEKTGAMAGTVFNAVERVLRPKYLRDLTAERLSYLQSELRAGDLDPKTGKRRPRVEATVKSYLAHLKAALRWAVDVGMLPEMPKVKMPKRARGSKVMKGRPITTEEFERMLAKVEDGLLATRPTKPGGKRPISAEARRRYQEWRANAARDVADSWRRLLTGLWLSGLRLDEAIELSWEAGALIGVDLSGRRPMFRIRAEAEKGNRDRILPMTPDFAAFLLQTPEYQRHGPVFSPIGTTGRRCRETGNVGKIISQIGSAARVRVDTNKFASAHDLRRSFGSRWATRVMPVVLQRLMRHEDVQTTMKYYVGLDAEATADEIWIAYKPEVEEVESPSSGIGRSGSTPRFELS